MLRRLLPVVWVIGWILSPKAAALAGTCGFAPEGVDPPIGTLDPLVEGSKYELHFTEGEGPKNLLLIFEVDGCELGPQFAKSVAVTYEFATVNDLHAFGPKSSVATATRVHWTIPVNPALLDAGEHRGTVVIGGNESIVNRVTIPVTLSVSESERIAFIIAGVAWLFGVLLAYFTSATARSPVRFGIGIALTAAPVYTIVKAQYWDVQGWTGSQAKIYLFIGVLAASFGAAKAAMLDMSGDGKGEPKAQPQSPSAPEPSPVEEG